MPYLKLTNYLALIIRTWHFKASAVHKRQRLRGRLILVKLNFNF